MSELPERLRLVRQWVEKAQEDLRAELLPPELRPPIDASVQERLTDYATVSRYPGDDVLTQEHAEEAVAAARKVREAVFSALPRAAVERLP